MEAGKVMPAGLPVKSCLERSTLIKRISNFLIYKGIQNGVVAKTYMTNGLLKYEEIFAHFLIYDFATAPL